MSVVLLLIVSCGIARENRVLKDKSWEGRHLFNWKKKFQAENEEND